MMKRCSKCGETKPLDAFSPDKRKPDGRQYRCKVCRVKHRNLETKRTYDERWRIENQEHKRAYNRAWFNAHPGMRTEYGKRYLERRRANGGSFTNEEFQALCAEHGNRCARCDAEGPLQSDHIIPVSKGGTSDIANIQPLCAKCNSKKHTKAIDYRRSISR